MRKGYETERDDRCGQVIERNKATIKLFVSHELLAKAVEQLCATSTIQRRAFFGITFEFASFLAPSFDMRNVAMPHNDFQRRPAGIARVGIQVLVLSLGRLGALDHNSIEHSPQLRDVMPVGAGHDER